MAHDDHTAHSHDHADHADDEHEHTHPHTHEHEHEHSHASASGAAPAAETLPDLAKVAILIHNWIDHNEGHRRTYLEWRDKLAEAGVPATVAALARVADLTDQATAEFRAAAAELQKANTLRS